MIARDEQGLPMAAATSIVDHVASPKIAEVLALRWSLGLARDLGFQYLVFEIDCFNLFEMWKQNSVASYFGSIVQDCFYLAGSFL